MALAFALEDNATIKKIELGNNNIGSVGIDALYSEGVQAEITFNRDEEEFYNI